jgi:hypothetical protein
VAFRDPGGVQRGKGGRAQLGRRVDELDLDYQTC